MPRFTASWMRDSIEIQERNYTTYRNFTYSYIIDPPEAITLTVAQTLSSPNVLRNTTLGLTFDAQVQILDTAANIAADFDALAKTGYVAAFYVTGSDRAQSLSLTAAQVANNPVLVSKLKFRADGTSTAVNGIKSPRYRSIDGYITVKDTAAAVSAYFDGVIGAPATLVSIRLTDTQPLRLSFAQRSAGLDVLTNRTFGPEPTTTINRNFSIAIYDTVAAINANPTALQLPRVVALHVIDTAANVVDNLATLTANTSISSIQVKDTVANVAANIAALQSSAIVSITLTDPQNGLTLTVAQLQSDAGVLGKVTNASTFRISDTAENIQAALDFLQNKEATIKDVIVTDASSLQVSIARLTADAAILAKAKTAGGAAIPLAVSDTAANILANLGTLNTSAAGIASITVSDGQKLTLSAAHLSQSRAALGKLQGASIVTDAAVLVANLDWLNDNNIRFTSFSTTGDAAVNVTIGSALRNLGGLLKLRLANGSSQPFGVVDTPASYAADLDALHNRLGQLGTTTTFKVVGDAPLLVSAAQLLRDYDVLQRISYSNGLPYQVSVSDSVGNILSNLHNLQTLIPAFGRFDLVDSSFFGSLYYSYDQFIPYADVLSRLKRSDGSALKISVTATSPEAIVGGLDALQARSASIAEILVGPSGSAPALSLYQFVSNNPVLAMTRYSVGDQPVQWTLSGSAGDIANSLAFIQGNAHLTTGSITVTDNGTVPVSVLGLALHAPTLARLVNADSSSYRLAIHDGAGAIVGNLTALAANSHVAAINVTDSATAIISNHATLAAFTDKPLGIYVRDLTANIVANLGQLEAINASIGGFARQDANEPVDISGAQLALAPNVLIRLSQTGANLRLTGSWADVSAALGALPPGLTIGQLRIEDTAASINANRSAIAAFGIPTAFQVTDGGVLSAGTIADARNVIESAFPGPYPIVAAEDTAAGIAAEIFNVHPNIVSITVTDNAPISIGNTYSLTWHAQLRDLAARMRNADGSPIEYFVQDVAANLNDPANLALLANGRDLVSAAIIFDNAPLTFTVAAFNSYASVLPLIRQANGQPYRLQITDTAHNIVLNLDALARNDNLVGVYVTDAIPTVSATHFGSAENVFGAYGRQWTGPDSYIDHAYLLDVGGTAGEVSLALDKLQQVHSHIRYILLADPGTPLTLTWSQFRGDTDALARISVAGGYKVNITDVASNISDSFAETALHVGGLITGFTVTDNEPLRGTIAHGDSVRRGAANADASAVKYHIVDTSSEINKTSTFPFDLTGLVFAGVAVTDAGPLSISRLDSLGLLAVAQMADGSPLSLIGTSAEIMAHLPALQARSASLGSIRVVDSDPLVMTVVSALANHSALSLMVQSGNVEDVPPTLQIDDTAANISANLDNLVGLNIASHAAPGHPGDFGVVKRSGIYITDDQPLAVNVSQTLGGAIPALAELLGRGRGPAGPLFQTYKLALTDSVANVSGALGAIGLNAHIDTITLTDPTTQIELWAGEFEDVSGTLAKIQGNYSIHLTAVGTHLPDILDDLQANGHIDTITMLEPQLPLTITPTQQTQYADVLARIQGTYYLVVGDPGNGVPYTGSIQPAGAALDRAALSQLLTSEDTAVKAALGAGTGALPVLNWTQNGFDYSSTLELMPGQGAYDGTANTRITLTDTGNQRSYASRVETYTPEGVQVGTVVNYDDGSTADVTYTDGVRRHQVLSDNPAAPNTSSYSSVVTDWDASGVLASRTTTYDDGGVLSQTYQADGSRSDLQTYVSGSYTTTTTNYDAQGRATTGSANYTNGNTATFEWSNGLPSRTVVTDANGNDPYVTHETFFAGGALSQINIDWDNNVRYETSYSSGAVSHFRSIASDPGNTYASFHSVTSDYDAAGVLQSRVTVYDSTNTLTQTYAPDGARTDVTADLGNVHNYSTSTTTYDAAGRATGGTTSYDDGNTGTFTYDGNGNPLLTVAADTDNDDPFQRIEVAFDGARQIDQIRNYWDNGTTWISGGSGNGGDNVLVGGATVDIITGYAGNDTMTGNEAADTFWYADGWGHDTITDFTPGVDQLDLRAVTGLGAYGQLDVVQSGADTVISYTGNSITLRNVAPGQINPNRDVLV